MERATRYQTPFTCLMLDIDDFKSINDTHGHPFGDQVLRTVAHIIREQVRRVDTAGRYGGEEFMIFMPHTTSEQVLPLAERIRTEVQEYPFHARGENVRVTLSIGMATYAPPGRTFKNQRGLVDAADQALYQAKRGGKNQIRIYAPAA